MNKPLVSVHMLTYNQAPYVAKAIECVLAQKTSFPFELVIGEDCSTDGTREMVFDYAKRFPEIIRVITSDRNVGMRENANRVNAALRGKYIGWCEGDDYWQRQDKLQLQVDYLESHPDCGLVHSDQNRYFEEHNILIKNYYNETKNLPPEIYNIFEGWNGHHILTCTVMARKELVDKVKDDVNIYNNKAYIGGLDIPLFIELSMLAKCGYINESLATYTVRINSACHFTDYAKQTRFSMSVFGAYLYLAKKYHASAEEKILMKRYIDASLNCALWNSDSELAKSSIKNKNLSFKQRMMYVVIVNSVFSSALKSILRLKYSLKKRRFIKQYLSAVR
jgi:glycosyltransferase involved in cell wall biosynthesis